MENRFNFDVKFVIFFSQSIFLEMSIPVSKFLFKKVMNKLEEWNKKFYFVFVYCSLPGIVIPNIIISYYVYFTTDFGTDSFRLPSTAM